ncbi:TauD/TfdA family dioxygenase [Shewanella sp. SR44-3]|uniref:TauD/TfdA family dioxygenase n=1 Tax=Shewanella sp. SR44-3 TaxID=2760936 RepID=UPI0015FD12EA|nr:TauD/TfdA family dioxygenase [Shewanella sp. SR44-3]MBB1270916.1 TauD/TfdA family dioxygenase [Shewanella sp. SR44-3]
MRQDLIERGYVSFQSDSKESMLEVAQRIGNVFKVPTMPLIQTLTPRLKENELDNTYSGNFGVNEFPFHTDLAHWYVPPRYLFLRSVVPVADVETKLIDSNDICDGIDACVLSRAHFKPRKKLDRTANLLKVKQDGMFRWDSIFIEPANSVAKELRQQIQVSLSSAKYISMYLAEKGDCLLIDNWRMLHGRSVVSTKSMDRIIERVYFEEVII